MIGATLTTRLAEYGITKSTVTAFALTFLAYNFKFLWAPIVDNVRLPVIHRFGQRRSWLWVIGILVMAPSSSSAASIQRRYPDGGSGRDNGRDSGRHLRHHIDAYRIELLEPRQLGVGSGMSQYGWRIGSAAAGATALVVATRYGWFAGYAACTVFALPAMLVGFFMGEPRVTASRRRSGAAQAVIAISARSPSS
jgi:PAT family beta-lactamase induction signal transducer AmpG